MSFILDALKKSENERLQQAPAEYSHLPAGQHAPATPRWLWGLGALLAVNLVFVAALMLRQEPAAEVHAPVPSDEPARPASAVASPPLASSADPDLAANFSQRLELARQNLPARLAPEADLSQHPVRDTGDTQDPSPAPAPAIATTAAAGQPFAGLPGLNELRLSGRLQLPDMHIDMHVYSGDPPQRFVFINAQKYREHDTMNEGPVLREITRDGVILDYQGIAFSLNK